MATAARGRTGYYDARPAGEYGGFSGGLLGRFIGSLKDMCQGACSGFLGMIGAMHMTSTGGEIATLSSNVDFLDTLWASLSANGLAGPIELIAGLAMFLAARRAMSRMIGLLGFIAFMVAYAQGYTLSDMILALSSLLESASGILQSLPATQSA